jgi:hypothetical protein
VLRSAVRRVKKHGRQPRPRCRQDLPLHLHRRGDGQRYRRHLLVLFLLLLLWSVVVAVVLRDGLVGRRGSPRQQAADHLAQVGPQRRRKQTLELGRRRRCGRDRHRKGVARGTCGHIRR